MSDKKFSELLFPVSASKPVYKMVHYAYIHKEPQRNGITLNLLLLEYCDQCRAARETPYHSAQFNEYYGDYLAKTNAVPGRKFTGCGTAERGRQAGTRAKKRTPVGTRLARYQAQLRFEDDG